LRRPIPRESCQEEKLHRKKLSPSLEEVTPHRKRSRPSTSSEDQRSHKKPPKPLWGDDRLSAERDASIQRWENYKKNAPRRRRAITRIEDCSGMETKSITQTAFHRTTKEEVVDKDKMEDRKEREMPQGNKRTDTTPFSPYIRCKSPPTSEAVIILSPGRAKVEVVKQKVGQVRVRHVSRGYMTNMLAEIVIRYCAHSVKVNMIVTIRVPVPFSCGSRSPC
jgi:hypothetical protein